MDSQDWLYTECIGSTPPSLQYHCFILCFFKLESSQADCTDATSCSANDESIYNLIQAIPCWILSSTSALCLVICIHLDMSVSLIWSSSLAWSIQFNSIYLFRNKASCRRVFQWVHRRPRQVQHMLELIQQLFSKFLEEYITLDFQARWLVLYTCRALQILYSLGLYL